MGGSLRIGRILGIPLAINYSWFIIFFLITIALSASYFPATYPDWPQTTYWALGIATSLLFFTSVVIHELSHSVVALSSGIPVKSITLFIFGGISHIAREATKPKLEMIMAAAGPLSSLVLGGLFGILWLATRDVSEPLAALAWWLATINVVLAVFNMIPGFPLDGGRVLRSVIWWVTNDYRKATKIAAFSGQGVGFLFMVFGIAVMFMNPRDWIGGLWYILIGWFLENAAAGSFRQVRLRDALQGFTAGDLMTRDYSSVSKNITIADLVKGYILPTSRRFFLVSDNSHLEGIVTLHNVREVPQQQWEATTVAQAMTPSERLKTISPNEDAFSVLERMDEEEINQMPVVTDGNIVGMIARDAVLRFIRTRTELGM